MLGLHPLSSQFSWGRDKRARHLMQEANLDLSSDVYGVLSLLLVHARTCLYGVQLTAIKQQGTKNARYRISHRLGSASRPSDSPHSPGPRVLDSTLVPRELARCS